MDLKYEIRQMKRSDTDAVYDLVNTIDWNIEESLLECVFDTDPSGLVVVVKDDGEIIGIISYISVIKPS